MNIVIPLRFEEEFRKWRTGDATQSTACVSANFKYKIEELVFIHLLLK